MTATSELEFIERLAKQGVDRRFAKWVINYAKQAGTDYQAIDISAIYDRSLNLQENKAIIRREYPLSNIEALAKEEASRRQIEAMEQQANIDYLHGLQQQQKEMLALIRSDPRINMEKFFNITKHFLRATISKNANCCILLSRQGGLGKTHLTLQTLTEEKKQYGTDYIIVSGYTTPLEFFNRVFEHRNKIVLCDDTDGLFTSAKGIALIKSMIWGTTDNGRNGRICEYSTTSRMRTAPERYEFTGQLIFCVNSLPLSNPNVQSIISRSLFQDISFSFHTRQQILSELAKMEYRNLTPEQRSIVLHLILDHSDESVRDFSLRTLIKAYDLFIYAIAQKDNEQDRVELAGQLIRHLLVKDDELFLIKRLSESTLTVTEQIKEYISQTGKSRASYFRAKSLIVSRSQDINSETLG